MKHRTTSKISSILGSLFYLYIVFVVFLLIVFANQFVEGFKHIYNYKALEIKNIWLFAVSAILFGFLGTFVFIIKRAIFNNRIFSVYQPLFYQSLLVYFFILLIIQFFVSSHIHFESGWDVGVVRNAAFNIAFNGSQDIDLPYFNRYPNNIFPAAVLAVLMKISVALFGSPSFLILGILCVLVNLSVLSVIFALYKITKSKSASIISTILGTILILLSPWIVIPYTDTLAICFPAFSLFLYTHLKKPYLKYFFITFLSVLGFAIKPTTFIFLIALLIIKALHFIPHFLSRDLQYIKYGLKFIPILLSAILLASGMKIGITNLYKNEVEKEKAFSISHFLMMGLNPEYLGTYAHSDVEFSNSFPSADSRQKENVHVALKRLNDMGIDGFIKFISKKTILNYDDGTFSWGLEGNFYQTVPATENQFSITLRNYFYNAGINYKYFVFIQSVSWFVLLIGIVWCLYPKRQKTETEKIVSLTLFGASIFLMLFECRARYLFIFSPLFLFLFGIGFSNFLLMTNKVFNKIINFAHKRNFRKQQSS